jgi:hypothetical protein
MAMSFVYNFFVLWLLASLAATYAPVAMRGQIRLGLLAGGGVIVLLALLTQGFIVALFALTGVLAVFPEPLSWARDWLRARRLPRLNAA